MYCEASGATAGQVAELYSPLIDVSTLSAPALYFWQHRFYTTTTPPAPMDIEVTNDNGVTWTNVYTISGNLQTSNSGPWEDEIVNLPQFVGDTIQIRFIQTSVGCCGDAAIDSVAIAEAPSCPDPANVQAINVIDTAATLSWIGAVQAGTHEVWFGPQGFFQGTQTGGGTKVNVVGVDSLLLDTLSDASCYEFLVRGICGPGDTSNWIGPISFCTQCRPFAMPYYQSFDVWPPICWDIDLGTVSWQAFSQAGDGWAEADFWGNSAGNMIMNSPPINVTQDSRVRYTWSHLANTTSYPFDELIVRVSVSGSGVWDTLTQKRSIDGNFNDPTAGNINPGTGIEEWFNLDPLKYTGQQVVVQFWANTDFGPSCFINNFYLEPLPACPRPTMEQTISTQATSADITWMMGTPGASNWVVEYGNGDWVSGPGTFIGAVGVTNDTTTLTGLMANTNYCWRVAEICPNGTDTSLFTPLACFSTPCVTITAPYLEDFSGNTIGHWDGDDNCWSFISNNPQTTSSGGYSWEVRNTSQTTSGTTTGPDRDNTLWPAQGGTFITADVSGSSTLGPDSTILLSPVVDISGLSNPELEYHVHRLGTIMADLYVDINDGSGWINGVHAYTNQSGMQTSQADEWTDTIIDLSPYAGSTAFRVRFRSVTNGCCAGDNAVDDVRISDPVSCPNPSGFGIVSSTSNSATMGWDTTGLGSASFELEYGPVGFTQGNGTSVTTTGNSYTISGLTSVNLCQEVYLRAVCSATDTSLWVGPVSACPTAVPCDNFDQYSVGSVIGQSSLIVGWYGAGQGSISSAQSSSAPNSMYVSANGSDDLVAWYDTIDNGAWNFAFDIYVPTGTDAYYNFQRNYTHGNPANGTNIWAFDVFLLSTGTANVDGGSYGGTGVASFTFTPGQWNRIEHIIDFTNDTVWIQVNGNPTTAGWQYSFGNFTIPVQNNGINFFSNPALTTPDYYIDDFCVTPYVPSQCPAPTNLGTSNLNCTSVDLTWNSSAGAAQSWVEYGPAGFTPLTGAGTIAWGASPLSITGLTPGVSYDFYVADTCATDTSQIAGPQTFTVPSGPITAAFSHTFGSAGPTSRNVFFDASASQGATTYAWDFGDGNTGTGVNTSHIYTANGDYYACLTVTGPCGSDTICDTIKVREIGFNDYALANSLLIYPNPTHGTVRISFETDGADDVTISLLDITGKVILGRTIDNLSGKFEESLDIREFAAGTYMLRIESSKGTVVRRLIKE